MQIFPGSSNRQLAEKLARQNSFSLGSVTISQFANGEKRIQLVEGHIDSTVALLQSLSQPVDEHLIEFCLLADALSRRGATQVTGIIPWLGYSKQDQVFTPGEALSAQVVAQILQTTQITKLITFDLHTSTILGFFAIPVVELSAKQLFVEYFRPRLGDTTMVVAPDAGAVKVGTSFAAALNVPFASIDKRRDLRSGKVEVVGMTGDVSGKDVIMIDDMIVTGATVMEAANYLKGKGAKTVAVAATHHLHVPGVTEQLSESMIDEIVVTDTIEAGVRKSPKFHILSVAPFVAQALT